MKDAESWPIVPLRGRRGFEKPSITRLMTDADSSTLRRSLAAKVASTAATRRTEKGGRVRTNTGRNIPRAEASGKIL